MLKNLLEVMNEVKTKTLSMTGISPVHKTLYYEDAMSPAA